MAEPVAGGPSATDRSVPAAFARAATGHPDRVAFIGPGGELTYAALSAAVDATAAAVAALPDAAGPVLILGGHEATTVVAMLGVAGAGRTYLVLDHRAPMPYLAAIVQRHGAQGLVTDRAHERSARALAEGRPVIVVDDLPAATAPRGAIDPWQPLSVSYTSGSSGTPKAVVHSHRNVVHNALSYGEAIGATSEDRFLVTSPFSSVASATPTFTALLAGAALCAYDLPGDGPRGFARFVSAAGVTVAHLTPAALPALAAMAAGPLPAVRLVSLGGDRLLPAQARAARELFPQATLLHRYSTSETNWIAGHWLRAHEPLPEGAVPLGTPVPWAGIAVVDAQGDPVAAGDVGELIVTGDHLALGYLDDAVLSAARFVDSPGGRGGRAYRTGDRVRLRGDGALEYAGRTDDVVKVRGVLVDLVAVERGLLSLPGVRSAAVVVADGAAVGGGGAAYGAAGGGAGGGGGGAVGGGGAAAGGAGGGAVGGGGAAGGAADGAGGGGAAGVGAAGGGAGGGGAAERTELTAFVTGDGLRAWHVRALLSAALPAAMLPARIVPMTELPLTERGKVDRDGLRALASGWARPPYAEPADGIERAVADRFASVLSVADVGRDDDCFALGADSLAGAELCAALEADLGIPVDSATLLENPTPAALAALARAGTPRRSSREASHLVAVARGAEDRLPVIMFSGGGGGHVDAMAQLARAMDDRTCYVAMPRAFEYRGRPDRTVGAIAASAVADIQRLEQAGPVVLLGHSYGGTIALEAARQLAGTGVPVALVILLDTLATTPDVIRARRMPGDVRRALREGPRQRAERGQGTSWARRGFWIVRLPVRRARRRWLAQTAGLIGRTGREQHRAFEALAKIATRGSADAPYSGRVHLVRAQDLSADPRGAVPLLYWDQVLDSVTVSRVPGTHVNMTTGPQALTTAQEVDRLCRGLEPDGPVGRGTG